MILTEETYRKRFAEEIKMGIISYIKEEIQVIRERDPAIKSNMEVFSLSKFSGDPEISSGA